MSAANLSALASYAGTFQKQLISTAINKMDIAQDITLLPGIKTKHNFTKLKVGNIAKPFTSTHTPTANALVYSGRVLEVQPGKADLLIDSEKYRATYLGESMKPGFNVGDMPFEKYTWDAVIAEFARELNDITAYFGVYNAAGSSAIDIANGLGTLIAAEITGGGLTPVVTGATTNSNAVGNFEKVYKAMPVAFRNVQTFLYCSYNAYDAYCENYATLFGTQPIYNAFGQLTIRHSAGKGIIKPVTWMGTSGRLICSPKEVLNMGTDVLSDSNKINTVPDVWTLKAGLMMVLGFQISDLEAVKVNDIA